MRLKVDQTFSQEVREVLKLKAGANVALTLVDDELAEVELQITAAGGSGLGFAKLASNANAGATSITVDTLPGVIQSNTGQYVMFDIGTTEAELREITTVAGLTLSFARATTYNHVTGDAVYLVGAQGDLIPWSWWGGIAGSNGNTAGNATTNTTAFNRLMGPAGEIYNAGRFGISIDGSYYVNDQLKPERSFVMAGASALTSTILARSGFPFTSVGDVAIIHPYRDGSPVLFEQGGPSGRWWFRNFSVDGQNLSNSNGILSSPQQPDSTENLRITNCAGKYGLHLVDVQYHDVRNLQFDNCVRSLYMWGCGYVRVFNMNVTSPAGAATEAVRLLDVTDCSFYGALLETVPTGNKIINCTGSSSRLGFYDIYTSGFSGGTVGDVFYFDCAAANPGGAATYVIHNAHCAQNEATINMVKDVQRAITFSTVACDRSMVHGWAQDAMSEFVLGATNAVLRDGVIDRGSGTPESVVAAPVGSFYRDISNGEVYVKKTGSGNTGWKIITHA